MAAVSLAIIGKNNEPLYLREFFGHGKKDDDGGDAGSNVEAASSWMMIPTEELFGITRNTAKQDTDTDKEEEEEETEKATSTTSGGGCSLRQQFLLHAALDRFEELSGPPPGFAWRRRHNNHNTNINNNNNAVGGNATSAADAMFAGLLCPQEELRVYGYMTTTRVKFLVTIREDVPIVVVFNNNNDPNTTTISATMDEHLERIVQQLMVELHQVYVEYSLNPFTSASFFLSGPIVSQRFDQQVLQCVQAYNQRNVMFL